MIVEILLPKLGESVAEGTITAWKKQVGEAVKRDEILCEIGTDKVETELPSEYEGVVAEILANVGDVVNVGQAIAKIDVIGLEMVQPTNVKLPTQEVQVIKSSVREHIDKNSVIGFLTPVVRNIIAEKGLDLSEIQKIPRTGHERRLTKKDLLSYLSSKEKSKLHTSEKLNLKIEDGDLVHNLTRRRKVLAQHLQKASQIIPHVTTFVEMDVSNLVINRNATKEDFILKHQTKLTYSHFMQFAVVQALQTFPQLNSWLNQDEWIWKQDVNLGFATVLKNGDLVVPNIKQVNHLSFQDFVIAISQKAEQAKQNKLQAADLELTTFTVSNTGVFGSQMGTPIVSPPQVAVLAFGQIQRKPVVKLDNGEEVIVPASMMTCSLSYDHRVIDGGLASQFLVELKSILESNEI